MGVRRCKKEDLKRIARATGGERYIGSVCATNLVDTHKSMGNDLYHMNTFEFEAGIYTHS